MATLRSKTIRLAYQRPDLRPHLLPLVANFLPIPSMKSRPEGAWFIKQVSVTPTSHHAAVVTAVLEHEGSHEVRQIGKQVDEVPGTALKFVVQNLGGPGKDEQAVSIIATLDSQDSNLSGISRMKLLVDSIRGTWDANQQIEWVW